MTVHSPDALVTVYSSPLAFDASIVKAMLTDNGIPAFLEDANAPFAGLSTNPCHVMVEREHESLARRWIEEHEARRRETVDRAFAEEQRSAGREKELATDELQNHRVAPDDGISDEIFPPAAGQPGSGM